MKVLKVVLFIAIILQGTTDAYANKFYKYFVVLKFDTLKNDQNSDRHPDIHQSLREYKNHKDSYDDCEFNGKYSIAKRLKKYPFSKTVKILAVSYQLQERAPEMIITDNDKKDTLPFSYDSLKTGLHITNGILNYTSIKEFKKLKKQQIIKLTDIVFNTKYKKLGFNTLNQGGCFDPRNALIFYDNKGKIFDYLEICFECFNAYSPTNRINVGTLCNQKYELLRQFFLSAGIKYGTKIRERE